MGVRTCGINREKKANVATKNLCTRRIRVTARAVAIGTAKRVGPGTLIAIRKGELQVGLVIVLSGSVNSDRARLLRSRHASHFLSSPEV